MSIALADPSIVVNNEPVSIVPNSVAYDEGLGEQTMRAASTGGGGTEQVFANNVETNFGMVKFALYNDIASIELARSWKTNRNQNVVTMTGKTPDGQSITRSFTQAAILNNYEVALGSDTSFELEFKSNTAV